MTSTDQGRLAKMEKSLSRVEKDLQALLAEVQRRSGALTQDDADSLHDRIDEMMDLLYLIDEHLGELLQDGVGEK